MLSRKYRFIKPSREYRELSLLSEIARNPFASQRELAKATSLSLAVLNDYLDQSVSLGLVHIDGESSRKWRYGLTPLGTARLQELFLAISREIVQFYGQVKQEFLRRLEEHARSGVRRVVLVGAAETGELAYSACLKTSMQVVGVVDNDPQKQGRRFWDLTIGDPAGIPALRPDAAIITSFGHTEEIQEQLRPLEQRGIRVLSL